MTKATKAISAIRTMSQGMYASMLVQHERWVLDRERSACPDKAVTSCSLEGRGKALADRRLTDGGHPTEMEGWVAGMEGLELPPLHLRIQRGEPDPQQLRGQGLVATGMGQHAPDVFPLHLLQFVDRTEVLLRFALEFQRQ